MEVGRGGELYKLELVDAKIIHSFSNTGVQALLSLQVVVVEQILKVCRRKDKETRRVRIKPAVSQNSPLF